MSSLTQDPQDFLLEIFTEELPHNSLDPERGECFQIVKALEKKFTSLNIPFTGKDFFLTPRRIAVIFRNMAGVLPAQEKITQGPPLSLCFKKGKPSAALIGFTKNFLPSANHPKKSGFSSPDSVPVWVEDRKGKISPGFYRRTLNQTDFLIRYDYFPEREVTDILLSVIPEVLEGITFSKSMYWGERQGPFLRPIRSLLALWGKEVVPLVFCGLTAGKHTQGHRFLSSGQVLVSEASLYQETLLKGKVVVDPRERMRMIIEGVEAIEKAEGVTAIEKSKITAIVSRLTEYPVPVYAQVAPQLIEIPREVVVSEMVEHQMYFPVENRKGDLIPGFIFTANGIHTPEVVSGNRNVLSSRLSDGIFLFQEDLKTGLERLSQKTDAILFEKTLGTYADKCDRIAHLALLIQKHGGFFFSGYEEKTIIALARLVKCDLASGMVYEFPHLQGTMGYYYAERLRENKFRGVPISEEMAEAIRDHYLPLSAQGDLPKSCLGILLSLADKLDNLLGLFAVGLVPTGNHDPYALRRQGYALLRILAENYIFLPLNKILKEGNKLYSKFRPNDGMKEVSDFLESRFKTYAKDRGFNHDEVEAISHTDLNPYDRILKMNTLREERNHLELIELLTALKRITNITEKNISFDEKKHYTINEDDIEQYFQEVAEQELLKVYLDIQSQVPQLMQSYSYREILKLYYRYPSSLERFFEAVMVNVKQEDLRRARLSLLGAIIEQMCHLFDLRKIKIADK